jgi:hypothetical protein
LTTPAAAPAIGAPLAYLGEAVAAAAVVQTAGRLGVLARLDGAPATTAELTDACEISERGARLLLGALAGLGLAEAVGSGAWRAALPDLAGLAGTAGMWAHLAEALREDRPLLRGDTPEGAAAFYPGAVSHLGAMLSAVAERAAKLLPPAGRVLDAGAGAAPWSLAVAARDPACLVTAVDQPAVVPPPAGRCAARAASGSSASSPATCTTSTWGAASTTWPSPATSATCSTGTRTAACSAACTTRSLLADGSPSWT